jgi:hypothetical protein
MIDRQDGKEVLGILPNQKIASHRRENIRKMKKLNELRDPSFLLKCIIRILSYCLKDPVR